MDSAELRKKHEQRRKDLESMLIDSDDEVRFEDSPRKRNLSADERGKGSCQRTRYSTDAEVGMDVADGRDLETIQDSTNPSVIKAEIENNDIIAQRDVQMEELVVESKVEAVKVGRRLPRKSMATIDFKSVKEIFSEKAGSSRPATTISTKLHPMKQNVASKIKTNALEAITETSPFPSPISKPAVKRSSESPDPEPSSEMHTPTRSFVNKNVESPVVDTEPITAKDKIKLWEPITSGTAACSSIPLADRLKAQKQKISTPSRAPSVQKTVTAAKTGSDSNKPIRTLGDLMDDTIKATPKSSPVKALSSRKASVPSPLAARFDKNVQNRESPSRVVKKFEIEKASSGKIQNKPTSKPVALNPQEPIFPQKEKAIDLVDEDDVANLTVAQKRKLNELKIKEEHAKLEKQLKAEEFLKSRKDPNYRNLKQQSVEQMQVCSPVKVLQHKSEEKMQVCSPLKHMQQEMATPPLAKKPATQDTLYQTRETSVGRTEMEQHIYVEKSVTRSVERVRESVSPESYQGNVSYPPETPDLHYESANSSIVEESDTSSYFEESDAHIADEIKTPVDEEHNEVHMRSISPTEIEEVETPKTPITQHFEHSDSPTISISSASHHRTLQDYRKQQQRVQSPACRENTMRITRGMVHADDENLGEEEKNMLIEQYSEHVKDLNYIIGTSNQQTAQASKGIHHCIETKKTDERIAMEVELLYSWEKRRACEEQLKITKEHIKKLKNGIRPFKPITVTGSMSIRNISFGLDKEFINSLMDKPEIAEYYLILIKHESTVMKTEIASTTRLRKGEASPRIVFTENGFEFTGLKNDFNIVLEIYGMIGPSGAPVPKKKESGFSSYVNVFKKAFHDAFTHEATPFPKVGSPANVDSVVQPMLNKMASAHINMDNYRNKSFKLQVNGVNEKFHDVSMDISVHPQFFVHHNAFLSVFLEEPIPDVPTWNRRYVLLADIENNGNPLLQFWTDPDEFELRKSPCFTLNLKHLKGLHEKNRMGPLVQPISSNEGARFNSFRMKFVDKKGQKVVYQFAADSKEELIIWLMKINRLIDELERWSNANKGKCIA